LIIFVQLRNKRHKIAVSNVVITADLLLNLARFFFSQLAVTISI